MTFKVLAWSVAGVLIALVIYFAFVDKMIMKAQEG